MAQVSGVDGQVCFGECPEELEQVQCFFAHTKNIKDFASLDPLSDGDLTWLRASGTRGRKSHGS